MARLIYECTFLNAMAQDGRFIRSAPPPWTTAPSPPSRSRTKWRPFTAIRPDGLAVFPCTSPSATTLLNASSWRNPALVHEKNRSRGAHDCPCATSQASLWIGRGRGHCTRRHAKRGAEAAPWETRWRGYRAASSPERQLHRRQGISISYLKSGKNGAPEEIRTPNLLIRSQMLYPVELRAHAAGMLPKEGPGEKARTLMKLPPRCKQPDRPAATPHRLLHNRCQAVLATGKSRLFVLLAFQ